MYEIRTAYKERVTSLGLNKKIKGLIGVNSIIDGFNVTINKSNLTISNGKCFIEGAYIESKYKPSLVITIPQNLANKVDLWLSLQYNHQTGVVREILTDTAPSDTFAITICKLRKSGETFTIEASKKIYTLGEASTATQETMKKLVELEKTYNDQIKNTTIQNPSNMEVVDARGKFGKLKDRLDSLDLESTDAKDTIASNSNRIAELEDTAPIWQEHSGTKNITIEKALSGFAKDMVIKGKTLQNLVSQSDLNLLYSTSGSGQINKVPTENGMKYITRESGESLVTVRTYGHNLLKPNTTYTISFTIIKNDIVSHKGISVSGVSDSYYGNSINRIHHDSNFDLSPGKKIIVIKTPVDLSNFTGFGFGFPNIVSTVAGLEFRIENTMVLEGDWSNKEIPAPFDSIVSCGEGEGNKLIVKSTGKNLYNYKEASDSKIKFIENGIEYWNNGWDGIKQDLKLKPNTTYYIRFSKSQYSDITIREKIGDHAITKCTVGEFIDKENIFTTRDTGDLYIKYASQELGETKKGTFYNVVISEESTLATEYVPYREDKKEILLPCPHREWNIYEGESGKYVEGSKKIILNGSENWETSTTGELTKRYVMTLEGTKSNFAVCDKFQVKNTSGNDEEVVFIDYKNNKLYLRVDKTKLETLDSNGIKKWLQANPTTVIYQLKTPIEHNIEKMSLETYHGTTHIIQENKVCGEMSFKVAGDRDAVIEGVKTRSVEIISALADCIKKDGSVEMTSLLKTLGIKGTVAIGEGSVNLEHAWGHGVILDGNSLRCYNGYHKDIYLGRESHAWKDMFIDNSSGNFSIKNWINSLWNSGLLNSGKFKFNNSDGDGARLIDPSWGGYYMLFHIAVDIGSPSRYVIGYGARHQGVSDTHTITKLSNNGLDYGAKNSQGTQVINGASVNVVRQFVIACNN